MITVPEATKKIVERSRFLTEAISKRLINYSSLARYIKPELEEMLIKKVSQGSIIMSLKRLEDEFNPNYKPQTIFQSTPEIEIRSNLHLSCIPNNEATGLSILINRVASLKSFNCQNKGVYETIFILSEDLYSKFESTFSTKNLLIGNMNVSSLTIHMPKEAFKSPGIYYFFLKSLAWEGINVICSVSTIHEYTLVFDSNDIDRAFKIIKSIFS